MIVIDWEAFKKAALKKFKSDSALEGALDNWYSAIEGFQGKAPSDLQYAFNKVDPVPPQTVFNIRGNHYRLVAELDHGAKVCLPTHFLTHAEYNKEKWRI